GFSVQFLEAALAITRRLLSLKNNRAVKRPAYDNVRRELATLQRSERGKLLSKSVPGFVTTGYLQLTDSVANKLYTS
ncbi:MAG TPA: hypothetical protein VGN34_01775, partial [Ktedonobacteraceae bacterium]